MRHLYSALLYCLLPLLVLRMVWRSRRAPAYRRRMGERLGFYRQPAPAGRPVVWVHAVSVGEVAASALLVERLLAIYPGAALVVTTATPTGAQRVRDLFGDSVRHVYCPWDLPGAVQRFLAWARPDALLLVETELWPNILHYCRARGCRTVLVNGRLSRRSARRYARLGPFSRWLVRQPDSLVCRGEHDSKRFLALGADRASVSVSGNLKWDAGLKESVRARGERLRAHFAGTQVLLAASTHPGEERAVLEAWREVTLWRPGCRLALVPRHPERAGEVAALCAGRGLRVASLSAGLPPPDRFDVLLGDTVGDLAALYAIATVAFVGGSLVPVGGHNPLEAALWGVPVISGPELRNFEDIYRALATAGGCRVVRGEAELAVTAGQLLDDEAQRARMSAAALAVVERHRGALERVLAVATAAIGPR